MSTCLLPGLALCLLVSLSCCRRPGGRQSESVLSPRHVHPLTSMPFPTLVTSAPIHRSHINHLPPTTRTGLSFPLPIPQNHLCNRRGDERSPFSFTSPLLLPILLPPSPIHAFPPWLSLTRPHASRRPLVSAACVHCNQRADELSVHKSTKKGRDRLTNLSFSRPPPPPPPPRTDRRSDHPIPRQPPSPPSLYHPRACRVRRRYPVARPKPSLSAWL